MSTQFASSPREPGDAAEFVVGEDGRVHEANDLALSLLGVTLDELRAAPPGAFSVPGDEADAEALRRAWMEEGATAAVGQGAIRRADGQMVRVQYFVGLRADARYVVGLRPLAEGAERATVLATASHALAAWRAAERRLEVLEPGSPDWQQAQLDVSSFREEYRRLFEARRHE